MTTDRVETPASFVPMMSMAFGAEGEVAQPVTAGNPLPVAGGAAGSKDDGNSTTTPLGADETFTGEWLANNDPQIGFNALADQDGELFLEFSIDGTTALQTLSKRYEVFADQGEFDVLVKLAGRFHRIRYVNGSTAQTKFGILTSTGSGMFPFSLSDRDAPKLAVTNETGVVTEQYEILVDLSDRVAFPHNRTGRVDIHTTSFFIDRPGTSQGQVQIGVITRIDGTSADIAFVQGVGFTRTAERSFQRDRIFKTPIGCGQDDSGNLTQVATSFKVTGATLVNTGAPLPTSIGTTATPAKGDLVVRYVHDGGGAYDASVLIQYSTSSSTR